MGIAQFDREYLEKGCSLLCGVDEAGRGPLAGPVFAAAVILPAGCIIEGVDDSKKLTEKKREALFDIITQRAQSYCIASASAEEIDEHNILQATYIAMRRAVDGLGLRPDFVLVDGNRDPGLGISTETIIKGDSKSQSIAAASILAKVARDRLMTSLAQQYPQYNFAKHKGYPTKEHYELIAAHGISPVHRRSFLKKLKGGV